MEINAFVLRYKIEGVPFAVQFLESGDFDLEAIQEIYRELGRPFNKKKSQLIGELANLIDGRDGEKIINLIIQSLVAKKKSWLAVKTGHVTKTPKFDDPSELVTSEGKDGWYGPISCKSDEDGVHWYIRQKNIIHWEYSKTENKPIPLHIRWLVFARVTFDTISLHWRGFSFAESEDKAVKTNSQFNYWRYIPEIFDEIELETQAKVQYINLHELILQQWWERFRDNANFSWVDRRIRAESSGVSLNAHAGAVFEIEAGGIKHLAHTIRKSIERELVARYNTQLPESEKFDEVILQTLIREYGTLSYEFSLEKDSDVVFRAHSYFGQKQLSDSPDKFPHMNVHVTHRSDVEQLSFILKNNGSPDAIHKPEQFSFLK